jgi:hypothetical protein
MADGIAKGVGEQIGGLVKQVAIDIAKTPAKIVGLDETLGIGGSQKSQTGQKINPVSNNSGEKNISKLAREDEITKQQQLIQARRLLQQIGEPQNNREPSVYEKNLMEAADKQKQMLIQQKKAEQNVLKPMSTKARQGSIGKQSGSETKLNIKAQ